MGISGWWLYDLVVIAVAALCIWNGSGSGIIRSCGSLVIGIVSCLVASLLSGPVTDAVYDSFFKDSCQEVVTAEIEKYDIRDDVREKLSEFGITLPYEDAQIADFIDSMRSNDMIIDVAALFCGVSPDEMKDKIGEAVAEAIESNDEYIPDWVERLIRKSDGSVDFDAALDTLTAILRNDYANASANIESVVIRPIITNIIRLIVFAIMAAAMSFALRAFLLLLPKQRNTTYGMIIGGAAGAARAVVYLFIIVKLVSGIVSMQSDQYPFYTNEAIDKTLLFHLFYNMWI